MYALISIFLTEMLGGILYYKYTYSYNLHTSIHAYISMCALFGIINIYTYIYTYMYVSVYN